MIAASIVTYHTPDRELVRCLESLRGGGFSDVYVIDNSRCDATRRLCDAEGGVTYIPQKNVGYGAAHNIALRRSLGKGVRYHLVLNPDVAFLGSSIVSAVDYLDAHPEVGALQPRICNPDGSEQFTVHMLPTPWDLILRRFMPRFMCVSRRQRYDLRHVDRSVPFNPPCHQGSFMLLRCSVLEKVGLFDERFFMYPEDIDMTRRIHEVARTEYYPYITVIHDHRAASYHSFRMLGVHVVNMIKYFNKWGWLQDPQRCNFNRPFRQTR